jgi:hypothetical protein
MAKIKRRVTNRTRFEVMRRDGFVCRLCGRASHEGVKLHVDHIVALSKGGSNDQANLWTLCNECNSGKSDLPLCEDAMVLPWVDFPDDPPIRSVDDLMDFDRHACNVLGIRQFIRPLNRFDLPGENSGCKPLPGADLEEWKAKATAMLDEWEQSGFDAIHVVRISDTIRARRPTIGRRLA